MTPGKDNLHKAAARDFVAATIACLQAYGPSSVMADECQIFAELLTDELGEFVDPTPVKLPCVDYLPTAIDGDVTPSIEQAALFKACIDVVPFVQWRNKYQNGGSPDLAERFGYCDVVGPDGYWKSDGVTLGLVLMGPNLFYPFHQHPARELYLVLTGNAEWAVDQKPMVRRAPGAFILHTENQPHAIRSLEQPMLAISLWRGRIRERSSFTDQTSSGAS